MTNKKAKTIKEQLIELGMSINGFDKVVKSINHNKWFDDNIQSLKKITADLLKLSESKFSNVKNENVENVRNMFNLLTFNFFKSIGS